MRYLSRCRFGSVAIRADDRLTVTLVDPDQRDWTFDFPRARLSFENWPGVENAAAAQLDSSEPEPGSGITQIDTGISVRDGLTTYRYSFETSTVYLDIESDAVEVTPPANEPTQGSWS